MILFYLDWGAVILGAITWKYWYALYLCLRYPCTQLLANYLTKHDHRQDINSALRELPRSEE